MKIPKALTQLGNTPVTTFLKDYWQKKTLVVKQALTDFKSPLSAEELAGFALEEEINSRLIIEKPNNKWEVQHGPLDENIFSKLPESHWTLLVQNVDALDGRVNALLSAFRFIPNWRLDDIMISYAVDQGSVGPHFDYYDVFLLQAEGTRRWKLGQHCDVSTELLPDQDMKILKHFEEKEEYLLTPGDMLYIPPGVAHWGIAEGECMTISIGFRAPSHAELLLEVAQEYASELTEDQRYSDLEMQNPELQLQNNPGEIKESAIEHIANTLNELTNDKNKLAEIFGKMMTRKNHDIDFDIEAAHSGPSGYRLISTARCAYYGANEIVTLFINGQSWTCSVTLAIMLSEFRTFNLNSINESDSKLTEELIELNLLEFYEE